MAETGSERSDNQLYFQNMMQCKEFAFKVLTVYGIDIPNLSLLRHIAQLSKSNESRVTIFKRYAQNPAIQILLNEASEQEREAFGGDNFVIIFSGALLEAAEKLLLSGLSYDEVIDGYNSALCLTLKIFQTFGIKDDRETIPFNYSFPDEPAVDLQHHMQNVDQAVICIYDFKFYGKDFQHDLIMNRTKEVGANVIVTMGFDYAACKSLKKKGLLGVGLRSKVDLNRVCKAVGASPLNVNQLPDEKSLGVADCVAIDAAHRTMIVVFVTNKNIGNEIVIVQQARPFSHDFGEECDDRPVHTPLEGTLANYIRQHADKLPPSRSTAANKFADALDFLVKFTPENVGFTADDLSPDCRRPKKEGDYSDMIRALFIDGYEKQILDDLLRKLHGVKRSVSAVTKILELDQKNLTKSSLVEGVNRMNFDKSSVGFADNH